MHRGLKSGSPCSRDSCKKRLKSLFFYLLDKHHKLATDAIDSVEDLITNNATDIEVLIYIISKLNKTDLGVVQSKLNERLLNISINEKYNISTEDSKMEFTKTLCHDALTNCNFTNQDCASTNIHVKLHKDRVCVVTRREKIRQSFGCQNFTKNKQTFQYGHGLLSVRTIK